MFCSLSLQGIRHQTKAIFEGVMKIHVKTVNGGEIKKVDFKTVMKQILYSILNI